MTKKDVLKLLKPLGEYTHNIVGDDAIILCDGKPMTPELIVSLLNDYEELKKIHYAKISKIKWIDRLI